MRALLIAPIDAGNCVQQEIDAYLRGGCEIGVNLSLLSISERTRLQTRFANDHRICFCNFDSNDPQGLKEAFFSDSVGYEAVILPYPYRAMDLSAFLAIVTATQLRRRLISIGVPNDATHHIRDVAQRAPEFGVAIFNTSGVHADSVAEFTLCQIAFHARRLSHFYQTLSAKGTSLHADAVSTARLVSGKTLGVIGGTGRDGTAIISLAQRMGMNVASTRSRSEERNAALRAKGVRILDRLEDLMATADFISINCRLCDETQGLIGAARISTMKKGVVIVCSTSAEVFDQQALFEEMSTNEADRKIGSLILDMPFGWDNASGEFQTRPFSMTHLRGLYLTPRIAGYTVESRVRASLEIAEKLCRETTPASPGQSVNAVPPPRKVHPMFDADSVLKQIFEVVQIAGREAERLRDGPLIWSTNADSPSSSADFAVAELIKDELVRRGINGEFTGEEFSNPRNANYSGLEIVIDGIDGTRNFRDRNFGWCISVAVCWDRTPLVSVVHDHHCGETYFAVANRGAFVRRTSRQGVERITIPTELNRDFSFSIGSFRVGGSSKRKAAIQESIKSMGGRGREWGSVALSICAVARGGLGAFIQAGSLRHDHIAAVAIAKEAGVFVNREFGFEAQKCDVVACHPQIADQIIQIYSGAEAPVR